MNKLLASLLATAVAAAQGGKPPGRASQVQVLTDMSGIFSDLSGAGSVEAARLAVEDFGGSVLGEPIEVLVADHQHKPDVGVNIARQWFDVEGVDVVLDVPNSAIALAVSALAKEKNKIAMFASAATDRLTEDACNGRGLHWTFDTYSQTRGAANALVSQGGDTWFLLVADYAYGHSMEKAMKEAIPAVGGKIVGTVRHPLKTLDFSSFLLQAQGSKAKIVALASGGEATVNAIKQGREFGLQQSGQRMASLLTFLTDVLALAWSRSRACSSSFRFTGTWMTRRALSPNASTSAWARCPERLGRRLFGGFPLPESGQGDWQQGSDKVVAKMQEMPVEDMFSRNGRLLPNGRMIHDMYLIEVKGPDAKKYDWDYYKILSTLPAEKAFRPLSESTCALTKK
ncbi:MAG: ABC transporter substrate-binding protein [Burkholderiaceae bacterium]